MRNPRVRYDTDIADEAAGYRNQSQRNPVMIVEMSKMRLAILLMPILAIALAACGDGGSGDKYDVNVSFNETVEQQDIDEVDDLLRGYDSDAEIAVTESFPPQLRATLETDVPDFCATVKAELEGRSYVREVTCGEH